MNKTIRSDGRSVIYNVYNKCLAEKNAKNIISNLDDVYQRTADMTGKSVSTVRRTAKEGIHNGGVFSSHGKHRKGRPKKELDNFDLCAIRQKIQFFYTVRKQVPTLRNLLPIVKEDLGFDGSREHLRKVLKALGFKYKKCQSERTMLMERPYIAAKRADFLKKITYNRNLPEELRKDIVYLDESYVTTIDIKEAAERAFQAITEEDWKNSCHHIIKIENEYNERELTLYEDIEQLVINLKDDSSSNSSSTSEPECSNLDIDMEDVEYLEENLFE